MAVGGSGGQGRGGTRPYREFLVPSLVLADKAVRAPGLAAGAVDIFGWQVTFAGINRPPAPLNMEQQILNLLRRPDYTPLGPAELLAQLRLPAARRRELEQVLARLERTGEVARIKQGNGYTLPSQADLVTGRIRMNRQGVGFLQSDDPKTGTIRIPHDATATAMNGDHVLVRRDVFPRARGVQAPPEASGRVVRVLEAVHKQIVGTLQSGRRFLYVIPDDPRITQDIIVPPASDVGRPAREGDKVVVELREWKSRHTNPEGEIIEVLGAPDAEGVDMLSVIRQYNLALHFPKAVLHEARAFGQEINPSDLAGRVDCRNHQVITIDPDDAKDFDDAICLNRTGPDQWKLWVHIADVSHYVRPGTALDLEASARGNSTYLVDRVVPMLPEALSNELCSLKPRVERLTKCVEFLLSSEGQVLKTQFYPAVIRSQCRYSYKEVFAILQREPQDDLEKMLHEANQLAQKIRRARFKAGSLDLDFPETKIRLDERGQVLRIEKVENDVSHQLIEEYMLLANEAVAGRLMELNRPAVYRIHEAPDDKRLQEYREEVLSHRIQCGNLSNRREVQKLLEKLNTLPLGQALKIGFLKSLMRARYAVEPLGHYGLAKKKYTHFTSPIRRYADLLVHRALFQTAGQRLTATALKEVAERISETERNSDDAERDSKDVKMFAFLLAQLKSEQPQRYAALVTDVRNFGFFVDVPGLGMRGLVPLSGLTDDFYQFDPARCQLIGRRTRRVLKLGDKLEVQVAKVDTFKRQVDFKLAQMKREPVPASKLPRAMGSNPVSHRIEGQQRGRHPGSKPHRQRFKAGFSRSRRG
jgi:ribonuclease R